MKPVHLRLLLTVLLFGGWLSYLGYQVFTRPQRANRQPLVLSRPQLLLSTVDVIADVSDPGNKVRVMEVLSPQEDAPVKAGDEIVVDNIKRCFPTLLPGPNGEEPPPPPPDYTGPGQYLLPLVPDKQAGKDRYKVAPTPPSPGYPRGHGLQTGPPRIYPATAETRAEYEQVRAHKTP